MSIWKKLIAAQKEERKNLVFKTVEQFGNNAEAARFLGISRQQVYQFLKQHKKEDDQSE